MLKDKISHGCSLSDCTDINQSNTLSLATVNEYHLHYFVFVLIREFVIVVGVGILIFINSISPINTPKQETVLNISVIVKAK